MTAVIALVVLLGEPAPRAENPFLAQARVLYQALEPKACLRQLDQAGQWDNSSAELVEIEILGGLCAFFVGDEQGAAERFERALRLSPEASLPPHTSPKIDGLFQRVRHARLKEADGPTADAGLRPWEVPAKQGSELAAAAAGARPRLVGPIAMLAGAVVAAAVGIVFGVMARNFEAQANALTYESDKALWEGHAANARLFAGAANVSFAVAGAAALSGGLWLYLSF